MNLIFNLQFQIPSLLQSVLKFSISDFAFLRIYILICWEKLLNFLNSRGPQVKNRWHTSWSYFKVLQHIPKVFSLVRTGINMPARSVISFHIFPELSPESTDLCTLHKINTNLIVVWFVCLVVNFKWSEHYKFWIVFNLLSPIMRECLLPTYLKIYFSSLQWKSTLLKYLSDNTVLCVG
jgi:hypothetical protein